MIKKIRSKDINMSTDDVFQSLSTCPVDIVIDPKDMALLRKKAAAAMKQLDSYYDCQNQLIKGVDKNVKFEWGMLKIVTLLNFIQLGIYASKIAGIVDDESDTDPMHPDLETPH